MVRGSDGDGGEYPYRWRLLPEKNEGRWEAQLVAPGAPAAPQGRCRRTKILWGVEMATWQHLVCTPRLRSRARDHRWLREEPNGRRERGGV